MSQNTSQKTNGRKRIGKLPEIGRGGAGSGKTVLITGGSGFIGTNLAHRIASSGRRVRLLDNLSRPGVEHNLMSRSFAALRVDELMGLGVAIDRNTSVDAAGDQAIGEPAAAGETDRA